MFSKVYSGGLRGIDGYLVQVEADVSEGLPGFHMVGYLAAEVREAEERVRAAMKNAGIRLPSMKVTVNLSPANIRKAGTAYDLPIAVAVLEAYGILPPGQADSLSGGNPADGASQAVGICDSAFVGELGLDGRIKPVRGILSMALAIRQAGIRRCFLPKENAAEGLAVEGLEIVGVGDLRDLIRCLRGEQPVIPAAGQVADGGACDATYGVDFKEVNGQRLVRRATEVAVAGRHNLLYIGPPGSGKSMIAGRIPTIMPSLSREEQMEISKIYSICGMLPKGKALMDIRPFRAPHHTISPQALAGGGLQPRPGELSLASRGVLFLDELPEFQKKTLEILRQPLEEHRVTVARLHGMYEFPAHVMLAAAMNPCPCGFYPDRDRCSCTEQQVRAYLSKLSRPLLDRIDICVEAAQVTFREIRDDRENESSADIRRRVEQAGQIQKRRLAGTGIYFNSEMGSREIRKFCRLGPEEEAFLQRMFTRLNLSARGCHKVLRVARTIADLDGAMEIGREHLCEAVSYRDLQEKYWGRERR